MGDGAMIAAALVLAAAGGSALYFLVIQPDMEKAEKAAPKRTGRYTELSYNTPNRVYMYVLGGGGYPSAGMQVDLSVSNMKWKVIEANGNPRTGTATVKIEAVGASKHDIPCNGDHSDPCGSSNKISGTWNGI